MEPGSRTRRIVLFVLLVVTVVGAELAVLRREEHNVSAAPLVAKQPVPMTVSQPDRQSDRKETQPSANAPDDASVLASIAEREVSQLQEGIALAKWMDARGKPEHWQKTPEREIRNTDWPRQECLSYVRTETLPSGAETKLAVDFYPPPALSPANLPTLSDQDLINTCVLATVRVEAEAQTPEVGHVLDQAVRQQLSKQYGESIGRKDVPVWGSGLYKNSARWIHNAEIVSGYTSQGSLCNYRLDPLVSGPVVFVCARLPLVQELESDPDKPYRYRSIENPQFHRAVALAGVDAGLSRRLGNLYEQVFRAGISAKQAQRPENTKWRELLLPVLRDWLGALKSAPPAQRAAGLLAADRLLSTAQDAGGVPGWPEKPEKPSELQKLGAVFEMNGIAGYYFYTSNWQKQAQELDPNGLVGQMAVIESMARGSCDTAGWGSDLFNKIVHDGEALLAKGLDSATAAQVHFMVGDAYSTIFVIANGIDPNGDYSPEQIIGTDAARTKALEHYRAGLAIDNNSKNAKDAWGQAWRLSAGLLPDMRYACFSD